VPEANVVAAPLHDLIAADYNAIEARGTAWLADAGRMLGIFSRGEDPYVDMASQIYRLPADKFSKTSPERQLGKAAILGLGYQMGAKRFMETCVNDGVAITEGEAERVKRIYREMNPEIPKLWDELEAGAIEAMRNEGHAVWCARGRIAFAKKGGWLVMRLPSGRLLWYPQAHLRERRMAWETSGGGSVSKLGVSFYGRDEQDKWCQQDGYGGRWVENAVSGLCRDLLAHAMLHLEAAGYPIVLSIHDEVVAEVPKESGDIHKFEQIMCRLPDWARGVPVKAEGWRGNRYGNAKRVSS
jgi:DNA polymerase bacteriophage-type